MRKKILIVEDLFIEANSLQNLLEQAGYEVTGIAHHFEAALSQIDQTMPDLVLLDIFLQGPLTGIDLAGVLKSRSIAFVYLSANSNQQTLEAAKATRPYGFLVKPFRKKDVLVMLEIAFYLHEHGLESVLRRNKEHAIRFPNESTAADETLANFHGIIGHSKLLQSVLNHLRIVAPSDTSVLILGESGTGKERIASCIHELSNRSTKPLIKVNCAALPATLIETILFGHERGAFTGATERKTGKFEQAHGGTLFLDEVGELPLTIQAKLLRVLQEKEIERLGNNETIKVDVRIIAATNRNLEQEVAERRFRLDLYYRLNVFPLHLPPLRFRKEDIADLVHHFIQLYARKMNKPVAEVSDSMIYELQQYAWPGNIRELENTVERMLLLSPPGKLQIPPLPGRPSATVVPAARTKTMEENEREHIITVLKQCGGKVFGVGGAAEVLGMNGFTLNSRIKKLGIQKHEIG